VRFPSSLILLSLCLLTAAAAQERATLEFFDVQTAVLDPADWDTPLPDELYFDALRPLLVRFPGSAEALYGRLKNGYRLEKAELVLEWAKQEGARPERGRHGWGADELYAGNPGQWHVLARPLRKPWSTDDPRTAPTFNAYINGRAFWGLGGGRAAGDRGPDTFGPAPLYPAPPPPKPVATEPGDEDLVEPPPAVPDTSIARLDVTKVLTDPAYGKELGDRLRALEDCGFQLHKQETRDMKYRSFWAYDWSVGIGYMKIWVKTPRLVVTLVRDAKAPPPGALPPAANIAALAAKGITGTPTIYYPADLPQRAAKHLARPAGIPDWQWKRMQELFALGTDPGDVDLYLGRGYNFNTLFTGTKDDYLASMRTLLRMPPRTWHGHQTSDFAILAYAYRDLLPPAVEDHLRIYWDAWLHPEVANRDNIGGGNHRGGPSYFRGYTHGGGTMNFGHNATMGAYLAGQFLDAPNLLKDARGGMDNIARQYVFGTGAHQEIGDTYYHALTLAAAGAVAKWAEDPFDRLRARIWRDRLTEPLMSMYHAGLRHATHPMGRGGYYKHVFCQDGPTHVLHTLSPSGVLMHLEELTPKRRDTPAAWGKVHGLEIIGDEGPPLRIGLLAPWTEPHLAALSGAVTDGKPLPARVFALDYSPGCRGGGWHVNFLGAHYALASRDNANHDYGVTSVVGNWRKTPAQVARLEQCGTLLMGFERNARFMAPANSTAEFGIVQRDGKLVALKAIPAPDRFEDKKVPTLALQSTVALIDFGDAAQREVWVNDKKIAALSGAKPDPGGDWLKRMTAGMPILQAELPDDPDALDIPHVETPAENTRTKSVAAAKDGDIICIKDGVSYLGFIPIVVNPLERDRQVEISYEYPTLFIHAFLYRGAKGLDMNRYYHAEKKATAGFVVEMADATEYPTFDAFRAHMRAVKLAVAWNAEKKHAEVSYASGKDTLEMAFDPGRYPAVSRKVNGQWPYLPPGIMRESSWAIQGSTGRIEKNGAVLESRPGRHAYLQSAPWADAVVAYNPMPDPMPWKLTLPGGQVVQANGQLGLARVAAHPKANTLYVEYAWRPGQQNDAAATALHLFGYPKPPTVRVNEKPAAVTEITVEGVKGYAVALP